MLSYHFFLTPRLIYDFTPFSVLAAVLVAFGVLSKHNEITAFKACGISVYRLTVPVLVAGFFLSGSLFAFDHYWVPDADRRQDALRNEIKGKAPQTYLRPDRKWIYGMHDRVYYYKYFDQAELSMLGVNVYEIDPASFRLKRHISAERARWEPALNAWVFQNGLELGYGRDMPGLRADASRQFHRRSTRTFPEIEETPEYFVHEVKQSQQMNFQELEAYIAELQQSGFDTVPLQVQLQQEILGAAVRPDHGDGFDPVRICRGESRRDGGSGVEPGHRDRILVGRPAVRAGGQSEPVAAASRRLVAGCDLLAGRPVFPGADADMKACVLPARAPIETNPLIYTDVPAARDKAAVKF